MFKVFKKGGMILYLVLAGVAGLLLIYLLINGREYDITVNFTHFGKQSGFVNESDDETDEIVLIATGDVMLGRSVYLRSKSEGDPYYPFRKTADLLNSADLVIVNLENPLYDPCPDHDGGFVFCSPTETVRVLVYAGVDVANIANNHIGNYGPDGYQMTISVLRQNGILASDEENLAIIEKRGTRFGFLGFNETFKNLSFDLVSEKVSESAEKVDVLIVSFHWGDEYQLEPNSTQRELARMVIDSGASAVIGHHPHVIQPVEIYNEVPIFYSLGNFVFDQMWSEETRNGALAKIKFTGSRIVEYELIGVYIEELGQSRIIDHQ